jgi:hypothetical protein
MEVRTGSYSICLDPLLTDRLRAMGITCECPKHYKGLPSQEKPRVVDYKRAAAGDREECEKISDTSS